MYTEEDLKKAWELGADYGDIMLDNAYKAQLDFLASLTNVNEVFSKEDMLKFAEWYYFQETFNKEKVLEIEKMLPIWITIFK